MATSPEKLPPENLRALDQLRVRLHTLSTSLGELRFSLQMQDPLPSWPQIQSSAQILSHHLSQLLETFQQNERFFKQAHAYPLPSFPGHTQHALIQQILRKKLEPSVENWVLNHAKETKVEGALNKDEQKQLLNWAGPASQDIVKGMLEDGDFDSSFTLKEEDEGVENVITGIKRKLYDADEEEGAEGLEGDKMEEDKMPNQEEQERTESVKIGVVPGQPATPLESVLKFMCIGTLTQKTGAK
ncbi:hypothetical protein K431DRAFT_223308 [Polychaeton citri CBS 116435]|uniref:Mediator of RNA polymerase II transcription subunit 8 n=1 Tax=Polychaeton citri CBS 116435 TaxID=1314669 RepID=A0A9P4URA3_9PEZI|nr:hypothetical protein K431DRAFT_223308 [Polychaeton citri CBS 116435]